MSTPPSKFCNSMDSSCSTTNGERKYDVFLSFRGEDTRNNFTSHLYAALSRRKIETFIDYELRRGDEISPALLKAIEESSLSIVILSKNYASSSWCLDELLKILECKNTKGHIMIPVFYHVVPSDVRKQIGSYGEAFAKHEKQFKKTMDKVRRWRAALTQVANLSGWHIKQHDGPESELVENIAKDVLKKLNHLSSSDLDGLIGIESHLERVESLLSIEMVDVRIIGIWGMGGIGKTTIARAIFDRIANQFEGCCFLANVREETAKRGLNRLQEELLSKILEDGDQTTGSPSLGLSFAKNRLRRKMVLIVLDDVDSSQQLKFFAGDHGWFGPGSRIIVTSRDQQVLKTSVDLTYEVEKLNFHESIQLFSLNAFKQNHPTENFIELSSRVIYYAQGIPLALKVLGCFLFGRSKRDWESALSKLGKYPNIDIQNVLRISYDGLDDEEKEIFLDITCFFKGDDKDCVTTILDGCGFSTEIGLSVLVDRCLITIVSNMLLMHDLIQEMGWGIVRQESIKEPGKRSRLWDSQDISNLFRKNTGTQSVEGISLDLSKVSELHLSSDAFMRMHKLRLLKFYSSHYGKGDIEDDKVHLCQGLKFLSDELRYLHWHRYPLKSLPSKFNPENLVELDMHHSNVEYLWKEKQHLVNLRRIDLSYSQHLAQIPDLTLAPNLEIIALQGCSRLTKFPEISWKIKKLQLDQTAIEEVPSAIECLNGLDTLTMINCTRLKNLPRSIRNLTSLMDLDLRGCSNIIEFPEVSGNIKYLHLNETAIQELPTSVECLTKLKTLSLGNCTALKKIPSGVFKLKYLEVLYLFGCSQLENLPEISESMEMLETLDLQGSAIKELPSSIENLTQLSLLSLGNCKNLTSVPNSFFNLTSLSALVLSGWSGVDKFLEDLPLSLFSGLCSLIELNLSDCNLIELPSAISCLSSLEYLDLNGNNFESLNLKPLSHLKSLDISYCKKLHSIEEFPSPLHLTDFQAHDCISLEILPNSTVVVFTAEWNSQQSFIFSNCFKLNEDAQRHIIADAQLRIQGMATNARETASMEDFLEWYWPGASVSVSFPGSEIPGWFSNQNVGSVSVSFPGSEIPGWFSNQNVGSSVTMELPQNWCYSNKFLGFALCVVVAFEDYNDYKNFNVECKCSFETNDGDCYMIDCCLNGFKAQYKPRFLSSDHVFLFFQERLYAMVVQRDDDDHWFSAYQSCLKASFEFFPADENRWPLENCQVKSCGVSMLYVEEEEKKHDDSTNEAELVESGSNNNGDEEKDGPDTRTVNNNETNPDANALCSAKSRVKLVSKILLVGLAVFFFLWYFFGIATVKNFK